MHIDCAELKRLAIAAQNDNGDYVALNDYGMAMPPAVCLALIAEIEEVSTFGVSQRAFEETFTMRNRELIAENERLRAGMKGDYDLDAWLDWTKEAEALRKAMHELANHPKLTASQAEILRAAMAMGEQP